MWILKLKKSSSLKKWRLVRIRNKRQQAEEQQTTNQPEPSAYKLMVRRLLQAFDLISGVTAISEEDDPDMASSLLMACHMMGASLHVPKYSIGRRRGKFNPY